MTTIQKGAISSAGVTDIKLQEFGITTEWAVTLYFQSPTGDSSDFLERLLPCLTREQAVQIADYYNEKFCPELVGKYSQKEFLY